MLARPKGQRVKREKEKRTKDKGKRHEAYRLRKRDRAIVGQHGLPARPIVVIGRVVRLHAARRIAQMMGLVEDVA
jgi:hypothetical protein